jgi:hypothetical protein
MGGRYTASKLASKDGSAWVLSFRHPLRLDPRGKQGLKIRRGLGETDSAKAQMIVDEMNELLGDPDWHSPARRAEAEKRFSPIVVRAFYDNLEANRAVSSWELRDQRLPLPGAESGYSRVLTVGTTGAGKTSLLRQLIGSHPDRDRFPSTSASRTTISDIEVITAAEGDFESIVTFFDPWTILTNVHECVAAACAILWNDATDEQLAAELLTHRDLRFRLGYIIGSWTSESKRVAEDDWSYQTDVETVSSVPSDPDDPVPSENDRVRMQARVAEFLVAIRSLAEEGKERLRTNIPDFEELSGADRDAVQDLFEDEVQGLPGFDDLVNDIIDEIRARFKALEPASLTYRSGDWPESWTFKSADRSEFIRVVRRFSSNYAPAFGTLLTPLVDGIRIKGDFTPNFTVRRPKLVLIDGEGLDHVADTGTGPSSRITRRFSEVDVILLVDSAKAPMLGAPTSVLRAVAASGYQGKLAIAFTHFDLLSNQANLLDFEARRTHVLSSLRQRLSSLREEVGVPATRALERGLEERCFMIGYLDKPLSEQNKGPARELSRLIEFTEAILAADAPEFATPSYDTAGLVLAVQAATTDFHDRWEAILGFKRSSIHKTAHWASVKALNRRVALDIEDGEYGELTPVTDLAFKFGQTIGMFLDSPLRWDPDAPSEDVVDATLSKMKRAVHAQLDHFVRARLLQIPRQKWITAFDYKGRGSTDERKRDIREIYAGAAPVPGAAIDARSAEFLKDVRRMVHDAIKDAGAVLVSDFGD